jgi:hypothetical protein
MSTFLAHVSQVWGKSRGDLFYFALRRFLLPYVRCPGGDSVATWHENIHLRGTPGPQVRKNAQTRSLSGQSFFLAVEGWTIATCEERVR